MKYRVIIKISYYEVYFDFEDGEEAAKFVLESIRHLNVEDVKQETDTSIILTKIKED